FDLGPLPFLAAPFSSSHPFELIVGESQERLHKRPREKSSPPANNFCPNPIAEITFSEQEMQRRRIALIRQTRPLLQRVKSDVHIMRPVAPVIPRCGPDKMRHRIQSENQ